MSDAFPPLLDHALAHACPTWFPPLIDYTLAHRCPTCGAKPGEDCDAPRKAATHHRTDELRAEFGMPPAETDRLTLQHATRQDAGRRHYSRDVARAPWAEDRVPGHRYDTLG